MFVIGVRDLTEPLDALISPYLRAHQDADTLLRAVRWLSHRTQLRLDGLSRAKAAPNPELISQARARLDLLARYSLSLHTHQA